MASIKRYYTLREAAERLGIPLHQARRWVKLFLPGRRQGRIRLTQQDYEHLQRIYQGFYAYRLRGKALQAFLRDGSGSFSPEPYVLLRQIYERLKHLEKQLEELAPPLISQEDSPMAHKPTHPGCAPLSLSDEPVQPPDL